jgi:hypothetical protein
MEELIAEEIKNIVSEFNYKIVYSKQDYMYYLIYNFKNAGSFTFDFISTRKFLSFDIELEKDVYREFVIKYGICEKENFLAPFFEVLRKELIYFSKSNKENLLKENSSE